MSSVFTHLITYHTVLQKLFTKQITHGKYEKNMVLEIYIAKDLQETRLIDNYTVCE